MDEDQIEEIPSQLIMKMFGQKQTKEKPNMVSNDFTNVNSERARIVMHYYACYITQLTPMLRYHAA
jgi:hypothetical protein